MPEEEFLSAFEATIKLGAGVSIDGYLLTSGEVRYGLEHISLLMGYKENYFRRLIKKLHRTKTDPKKLQSLLDKGFTAYLIRVKVARERKRGTANPYTLSFDDFCLLVDHEASIQNPRALALLSASFRELLRSRTHDAYGIQQDSREKKALDFQEAYDMYLLREGLLQDARFEAAELCLPGDEDGYELIPEDEILLARVIAFWGEDALETSF